MEINEFSGISSAGMIPRTDLIKKMKAISAKKNIFLTAPGGYGKTVAASQLLSSVRGKTAKITVGKADNDPGVFYKRFATALLKLTKMEKALKFVPDSGLSIDMLLEIIRMLPKKSARRYLVIDDMHWITTEEIINNIALVASRLPSYIMLCILSRSEPPAAAIETGLFELITQNELLFSREEVEWLGLEKERNLSDKQINEVLETTGGWAMYLSALLSGDNAEDVKRDKTPLTLTQYLDERVWSLWEDGTKSLMLKLAVPTEITAELCERLTGQADGRGVLERLAKKENAFLSPSGADAYRFHDIFREFLLERIKTLLGTEEVWRLNDVAAEWYYEQGDYFSGGRHYIYNRDHDGVSRCMNASNRFHEDSGSLSVETSVNFVTQYVTDLPTDFVYENPYLLSNCLFAAYLDGSAQDFTKYLDMMYQKMPEIIEKYPEHLETVGFECGIDFRVPLKEYVKQMEAMMPLMQREEHADEARSNTITQNLPLFHRSMRDYSEYYELNPEDLTMVRRTFGAVIGRDYDVMEYLIIAGIHYERGELLDAMQHSLNGYSICDNGMQPETIFSAHMMLATALYAVGASQNADEVMSKIKNYIDSKAPFLHANFKALQTERAIRNGDTEAAIEWLAVYANHSSKLPFYQMFRHFTTLRSFIASEDYEAAIAFGNRLLVLATEYNRPLDIIESGLLTAIALWYSGEKDKAVRLMNHCVGVAKTYGFTQLIINEGKETLPLLWELCNRSANGQEDFTDRLIQIIYKKHELEQKDETQPVLTAQQRAMLPYLSKGMTYSEIAAAAGLGRDTIKSHVRLMYKRLNVHSAEEAVIKAKMLGLI